MSSIASEPASGAVGTRTVASIIGGAARDDVPGGTPDLHEPRRTDERRRRCPARRRGDVRRRRRARERHSARGPRTRAGARTRHRQVGRLVEANKESLARLVTREIGKPYRESLGEVQEIVDTCDFFLGEGRRLYGQTVPCEMPDKQLFTFRVPVGVAAIITAGNFPVAVPSWYLVPALLCGNAVVWKPAEYSRRGRRGAGAPLPCRRRSRRGADRRAAEGARPSRARARWRRAWSTRSASPGRRASARGSASCAGATCSRRAWSWAARTRWSSWPTPTSTSPSRARCSAAWYCRPALHVARHGDRARVGVRRVPAPARRGRRGRRRRSRRGRALRPDAPRAVRRALRGLPRADRRPPRGTRLDRAGRITASNPREGFVGDRKPGSSTTRRS